MAAKMSEKERERERGKIGTIKNRIVLRERKGKKEEKDTREKVAVSHINFL